MTQELETQGGTRLRILSCETENKQIAPDNDLSQIPHQEMHSQSEGSETQVHEVAVLATDARETHETPNSSGNSAEEKDVGIMEESLAVEVDAYDYIEGEGEMGDGAVDVEAGMLKKSLEKPFNESRDDLVRALKEDHSLNCIKELADKEANGYKWEDGLVMKYQLDPLGKPCKKI